MKRLHTQGDLRPKVKLRAHSVVIDIGADESLLEALELLHDIHVAEIQLAKGEGIPHEDARAKILSALRS